jgi:hypothetical protein
MKAKVYRQQVAEKLKIRKLNSMENRLSEKEKENMKKASKLEKEILKTKHTNKVNKTISKPIPSDYEMCWEDSNQFIWNKSKSRGRSGEKLDLENRSTNNIKVLDTDETIIIPEKKSNAINLKEINQKLKSSNFKPSNSNIFKQNLDETQENTHNLVNHCECEEIKDEPINNKPKVYDTTFQSLNTNPNIPSDFLQFGKFLLKYIEQEENYRLLFDKENKKLRMKIKTTFEKETTSDHCLLDYIHELWDKLDISYINRYKILSEMTRLNARAIYKILDRETEMLTDYYQRSNSIFQLIKEREKIKSKIQTKINKSNNIYHF